MSDTPEETISRRNFIKASAAGLGLAAIPAVLRGSRPLIPELPRPSSDPMSHENLQMAEKGVNLDLVVNKIVDQDTSLEGRRQIQRELSKLIEEQVKQGTVTRFEQRRDAFENNLSPRIMFTKRIEPNYQITPSVSFNVLQTNRSHSDSEYLIYFMNLSESEFHNKVRERGGFAGSAGSEDGMDVQGYLISQEALSQAFSETGNIEGFFNEEIGMNDQGLLELELNTTMQMNQTLKDSYSKRLGPGLRNWSDRLGNHMFENGTLRGHGQPTEIDSHFQMVMQAGEEFVYSNETRLKIAGFSPGEINLRILESGGLGINSVPPMFGIEPQETPRATSDNAEVAQVEEPEAGETNVIKELEKEILRIGLLASIQSPESHGSPA